MEDIDLADDMGCSKRAWLGWLGEFIPVPLGLSTQADVQQVINHLKELCLTAADSLSDLQHTKNVMSKMVASTNERFNCSWESFLEMRGTINRLTAWANETRLMAESQCIMDVGNGLVTAMVDISFRVNAVINDLRLQQHAVDMWVESLLLLHENLLPPYLVPPEVLKQELISLGNSEQLHNLGLQVLHQKNVGYFYTQRLTTIVATNQTMFIHFRVALGSHDKMLKILFVDVFPLLLQPTEVLHHLDYEGYPKLNVEKPYLVVTHTGNGFVELSESEL